MCKANNSLIDLMEMISSSGDLSDLLGPTGHTQGDVPTFSSYTENLSCAKFVSSFDDMEQINFPNTTAATNSLTLSPILLMHTPTLISAFNHNDTVNSCNTLNNVENNLPILQISSEQNSTNVPCRNSTHSSTPVKPSSIGFNSNKSPILELSDSFASDVIMQTTSNVPKVRFVSKQTEISDGYTESSIEITSTFLLFLFVTNFAYDLIYILSSRLSTRYSS